MIVIRHYYFFIAAVGIGAMCGALCRHQIGKVATEQISKDPAKFKYLSGWHTAGINVLGSFILGGIFATPLVNEDPKNFIQQHPKVSIKAPSTASMAKTINKSMSNNWNSFTVGMTPRMKLLLGVGFCGSFSKLRENQLFAAVCSNDQQHYDDIHL